MSVRTNTLRPLVALPFAEPLSCYTNEQSLYTDSWKTPRVGLPFAEFVGRRPQLVRKVRQPLGRRMPARTATDPHSTHMPALPTTLEEEPESAPEAAGGTAVEVQAPGETRAISTVKATYPPAQFSSFHFQRDSGSTSASDSSASSPVTAPSLTDSFNNGDTPVTSPDTPASSLPPYSPASTLATNPSVGHKPDILRQLPAPRELPRPSTGPKKPRNLKNLAVDTSSTLPLGRAVSTASLPLKHQADSAMISVASTPSSSLSHPQPSRRKSSQLGLKLVTPPSNSPIRQQGTSFPPPTPSLVRPNALRHFPSSPLLPLRSPSGPPEGGMQLPPLANQPAAAVGFSEAPAEEHEDDDSTRFDIPQSREAKVAAYPDGPICIYDPNVYLYLEPTAAEASKFGVVLNVASEVINPFQKDAESSGKAGSDVQKDSTKSSSASTPTTPKAGDSPDTKPLDQPEYIHIPWEHNTDIVPELFGLSKLVDERVQDGKSVLIHCQCGVSRSASLIVAYGLYKNPSITVQEAYDAVKRRSKWIGPNMSLIMQLQEFRTELLKSSAGMPAKSKHTRHAPESAKSSFAGGASRPSADRDRSIVGDDRPRSAPLPPEKPKTTVSLMSVDDTKTVSAGPSSAPLDHTWPSDKASSKGSETSSAYVTPQESPVVSQAAASSSRLSPIQHDPSATSSAETLHPVVPKVVEQVPPAAVSPFGLHGSASTAPSLPPISPTSFTPFSLWIDESSIDGQQAETIPSVPVVQSDPLLASRSMTASPQPLADTTSNVQAHDIPPRMSPALPAERPSIDDMFGFSSPRTQTFGHLQPIHNLPRLARRKSQPLPRLTTQTPSPSEMVLSQRAEEFALSSVVQPPSDDSFGLTSPRATTFTAQLPYHGGPSNDTAVSAPVALSADQPHSSRLELPANDSRPQQSQPNCEASDRAAMRSRLGMSTSSSYDMRSEYVLAAKARELRPPTLMPIQHRSDAAAAKSDLSEALLSPRATELTANPFDTAMGQHSTDTVEQRSEQGDQARDARNDSAFGASVTGQQPTAKEDDPRSPPQRGISPIVRSIFDAIS